MIETEHLYIKPLEYSQLVKYLRCDNSLETELHVEKSSRTISPELKEALEQTIIPNVDDKHRNYLFSTLWTAISKAENAMVGDLCIMGEPDDNGIIEIGYGTYDEFRNKGFMTELVKGIVMWAKAQSGVKVIAASTDKTNPASARVLEKNGFILTGETDELLNWKLQLVNL
jgi:RimJ/RimL family protein N-acetyltransferase